MTCENVKLLVLRHREGFVNANRNLNDWGIEEYEALLQLLATVHVNDDRDLIM